MAAKTSPVTPSVLAWALEQDGRPLAGVAASLGVPAATLRSWVAGETEPTVGQVTDLTQTLRRPRVFFFLPQPPTESAMPNGFRHPPGGADRPVPASVLLAARRARLVQRAVASTMTGEDPLDFPRATVADRPERAAAAARAWLGVEPRETWEDDRVALRRWRDALDENGVLVFSLQLGRDEVRGFAAWDDRAPMIVVNSSSVSPAARNFTIGHELAHLVLREATACLEPASGRLTVNSGTERWCERFSAALLMPADQVRELMRGRNVALGAAGINEVSATMRRFRVSARAAALRLGDLEYAEDDLYAHVLAVFKPNPRGGTSRPFSPPRHVARLREYGEHTIETLMTALPPRDAMSVLRIDVEDARRLADEVPGVVAI